MQQLCGDAAADDGALLDDQTAGGWISVGSMVLMLGILGGVKNLFVVAGVVTNHADWKKAKSSAPLRALMTLHPCHVSARDRAPPPSLCAHALCQVSSVQKRP